MRILKQNKALTAIIVVAAVAAVAVTGVATLVALLTFFSETTAPEPGFRDDGSLTHFSECQTTSCYEVVALATMLRGEGTVVEGATDPELGSVAGHLAVVPVVTGTAQGTVWCHMPASHFRRLLPYATRTRVEGVIDSKTVNGQTFTVLEPCVLLGQAQ